MVYSPSATWLASFLLMYNIQVGDRWEIQQNVRRANLYAFDSRRDQNHRGGEPLHELWGARNHQNPSGFHPLFPWSCSDVLPVSPLWFPVSVSADIYLYEVNCWKERNESCIEPWLKTNDLSIKWIWISFPWRAWVTEKDNYLFFCLMPSFDSFLYSDTLCLNTNMDTEIMKSSLRPPFKSKDVVTLSTLLQNMYDFQISG